MAKGNDYLDLHRLKNVKLILGNGFDMACGLHSDYRSFFKSSKELYDEIHSYSRGEMKKYPEDMTIWDLVFVLCEEMEDNPVNNPNKVSWKDIEAVMRKALGVDGDYGINLEKIRVSLEPPSVLNEAETKILTYYQARGKGKEFYTFVYEELTRFETRFSSYIKKVMTPEYQENVERMFKDKKLFNLNLAELSSVDTFNYTTPSYFYKIAEDKASLIRQDKHRHHYTSDFAFRHINGRIDDAIFGIDSQKIVISDPRYIFTKAYRKMMSLVEGNREDHQRFFDNIVIYGHSLGEADYSYFFSVLESLNLYNYKECESRVILAFSDYSPNARKEVGLSMLKMLYAYDHWKNPGSERHGLTEIMETSDRVGFALVHTEILKK